MVKKTLKEMDKVSGNRRELKNPIDRTIDQEQRASEESKGVTERIRNIFDKGPDSEDSILDDY